MRRVRRGLAWRRSAIGATGLVLAAFFCSLVFASSALAQDSSATQRTFKKSKEDVAAAVRELKASASGTIAGAGRIRGRDG